ncbi:hypothetical protein DRP05_13275 [Archaeoglobales archaeon]|nr:MAG: hypothetical protein DRP05_13275 [Archaeoglobales archaeon]
MEWRDGFGEFLEMVKSYMPEIEVFGLDVDPELIKKSNISADFIVCDADLGLPFKDNSFDCVTVIQILEHISNPTFLISETRRKF